MRQSTRQGKKPHGIPPAPTWRVERNGGPTGLPLLYELPESLAIVLLLALRFISVWASCPPERRWRLGQRSARAHAELAQAVASVASPEIMQAVDCFARLRRRPSSVAPAAVASACEAVHAWAQEQGFRATAATALSFAEAAAYADPSDPRHANTAGAACRRAGHMTRAAIWLNRARRLGVNDTNERIRSLLAIGALMKETGKLAEAERAFTRAAVGAARRNRRRQAAEAHHDLLLLTAEQGRLAEAEEHALLAADLYPLYHHRLQYLAHDLAFALVRHGHYGEALALLSAFVKEIPRGHLLPGLSTFAWAAAGQGLLHRFRQAEQDVLAILSPDIDHEFAPASYIHLAEGARLLGLWEKAETHALCAIRTADIRQDPTLREEAKALLAAIHARISPPQEAHPTISRKLSLVTRHLTARLQRWRPVSRADGLHRSDAAQRP